MQIERITIVGLGLVGASLAAACRNVFDDMRITGIDIDAATRDIALANGWVDVAASAEGDGFEQSLEDADLVVLAVPASAAEAYFVRIDEAGYTGIITDTASTKAVICAAAAATLSQPNRFIPGHPMAGSEVNGIEGARADLFAGAHWILCPDAGTDPEEFSALHEFIRRFDARVISLAREEHDEAVAVVSHVPHIVASSLVELASRHAGEGQTIFRLAAGGFKDSTRIAAGSSTLWSGIAVDNAQALREGLSEMCDIMSSYVSALEAGDRRAIEDLLERAARTRRALPAGWVPPTDNLLEVRIPMQDGKGVVAEATTIASGAGCNIQSIEIDHITEDSAVLSMVLTDEGDIGLMSADLIKAGFTVSFSPLYAKEYSHVE